MRRCLIALVLLTLAMATSAARAEDFEPDRVDIEYVAPTSADMQPVYDMVMKAHVLERIKSMLTPFRLPRRLLVKTQSCNGDANAWYDNDVVVVCYEFIDDVWKKVPENTTPAGVTPIDAMVGPVIDAFLHEAGHAVFDMWKVPILGREEDAADYFSAYLMLQFNKEEARRLILGTIYQYRDAVKAKKEVTFPLHKMADEHGMPAQRFYNVLCIAYGSDDQLFADFVSKGYLPKARASDCKDEYKQEAYAFDKLLKPHIEPELEERLYEHKLPPPDRKPMRRQAR